MSVPHVSVVVPVYNEEESLPELSSWITSVCNAHNLTYEILFVDDGSSDESLKILQRLASSTPEYKVISFSRNYGKSAALQVGFTYAKGDVVITMDSDLQDSPDEIPELYQMIVRDGYDLVSGWKKVRHDPISKTLPSKLFNRVTQSISGIKLHDFNCGLKAYKQKVVKSIVVYGEMHRYIPLIAKWNGFKKIGEKVVEHRPRKYGTTKFGLERFLFGFLDLASIVFVSRFKKRPMHFFGTLGVLFLLFGLGVALFLSGEKLILSSLNRPVRDVTEQPLFYLALTGAVIGSQMFFIGFLGEMISQQSINKNDYLIAHTENL